MYRDLTDFHRVSGSTAVEGIFFAAWVHAWTAYLNELLVEEKSGSARWQKQCTHGSAKLVCMAKNKLSGSVREVAQYWHSKNFEEDTKKKSIIDCRNNVSTMLGTVWRILPLPSVSNLTLAQQSDRLTIHLSVAPVVIHGGCVARLAVDFSFFTVLAVAFCKTLCFLMSFSFSRSEFFCIFSAYIRHYHPINVWHPLHTLSPQSRIFQKLANVKPVTCSRHLCNKQVRNNTP